ncbi:MAG TPA: RDD family protein [Burkholderiales bacterium]|nr:RDD family protein [Burkholderiales bacterium]
MNYGGFWIRFVAYLVDSLIVTIGFVGIMLLISAMGLELAGAEVIFLVLAILYWALMQSSKRQATIGKSLCGLKVAGPNGERISVGRALGREAAKIISSLTMLIGFVIAAFTRNKQALHDFVASTYVVREGPSRVLAAVAIAVLALFAPAIAVAMFGAGALTSALGPMAAMLEDPVAMQKPAAQAPRPAAPAAPKPVAVAEAPKPAAEAPKPVAEAPKPAAEAPKPVAEAPKPAPTPVAKAPAAPAKLPEPAKSAPAPVKVAESAPVVEAPAKMEREPTPVIRAAVQDDAAPAPRIQVVAGPVIESKIRFNDLMTAVLYRDAGAVNDLLAFGKWPDKTDSSGMTPLMVAAQIGETAIAQALLKAGADPRRAGPGGQTAISIARERKDAAMLGLLQGGK